MAAAGKKMVSEIFESFAQIEENYGTKYTDKLFRNGYGKRVVREIYEKEVELASPI